VRQRSGMTPEGILVDSLGAPAEGVLSLKLMPRD